MSGMLCGYEGAVVSMAVLNNVVVTSGMVALVGWALVLVLGVNFGKEIDAIPA